MKRSEPNLVPVPGPRHRAVTDALLGAMNPAERIISKFGGVYALVRTLVAIGRPRRPSTLYRWTYPTDRQGTGGIIPTSAIPDIMLAARYEGIVLTPEDMWPNE